MRNGIDKKTSIVVLSDLDGTLLDSETYSAGAARKALDLLIGENIPLILCSSKTRAEIQVLQQELGFSHPFICENGGALYIPDGYFGFDFRHGLRSARFSAGYQVVEYGRPYAEVVETLHRTAEGMGIEIVGFSDLSVEEVAKACRLSLLWARLAKLREYDEPFWTVNGDADTRARLWRALQAAHLGCTSGGRFDHAGAPVNKGTAVRLVAELYERAGLRSLTVGLGDSLNDVPLLRQVDVPVVVQHGDLGVRAAMLEQAPTARVTRLPGPSGWSEAIFDIVDEVQGGRLMAPTYAPRRVR